MAGNKNSGRKSKTEEIILIEKLTPLSDKAFEELIDPKKILKRLDYEHPLFNIKGLEAQKRKREISGINNTYYCGAYWRNGFHEDGVVSALDVCADFGEFL